MNIWVENILRYIVLLFLQILLLNNIELLSVCSPCLYVLFLIALPPTLPRWVELLIGFAAGLVLDIFCNTLGVQTAACTLVAYLRPLMIKNMVMDNERLTTTPNSASIGWVTYLQLVVILVLVHHGVMFSLIAFSFHNWWLTLLQTIVSSIVTIAIILGLDVLHR